MTEKEIKLEARLIAIEYMITNLYAVLHGLFRTPSELLHQTHEKGRAMLSQITIPGFDAAQSDLLSAEIQDAADRMICAIEAMVETAKNLKPDRY